ncbi:F-box/FBD/LRR-repeat protein At5g53840 isoform X2 [Lathyrus oleraceus]|nr:F-box/FBD/LRR-repeat protein At5g53840-like isoform X2 [Pisum sativum]
MVSSDEALRVSPRKKRKLEVEDNANSVEEGVRPKEMAQNVELEDRISHLPDYVIHHILSFLRNPKDAIRTSSFSQRWRALWYSYAMLVFDELKFAARFGPDDGNTPLVDNWLTSAVAQDIKEIDLHVGFQGSTRYTLPQVVFSSETLTGLRLSGCVLQSCGDIVLPRLQKLYLRKLHLVEHSVISLISRCPSIEDLRFIQCSGLKFLVIYCDTLNRLEIHNCNQLKRVDIIASNLETFWFSGKKSTSCKVDLEHCKSLKKLTLEHPQVTRDFSKTKFTRFPLLEKLDLCVSDDLKSITIYNHCLQRIALKGCTKLTYAQIYAHKLVSFELKGDNMPYIDLHPFCLTDAKVSLVSKSEPRGIGLGGGNKLWHMMRPFISKFSPEGFKLIMHSKKNIIIHEDLSNIRFPPLHDLSFEIIKSSACVQDILYGLLRKLHPASVAIVSSSDSKLSESVYEMMKIEDEEPTCCRYNTSKNKCWRHFLKEVKSENWEEMLEIVEASEDEVTSTLYFWLQLSYSTTEPRQMTHFRLNWNTQEPDVET